MREVGPSVIHSIERLFTWHIDIRFSINNLRKISIIPGKCRVDYFEKNENYAQKEKRKKDISYKAVKKCDTNKQTNRMCHIEVAFHWLILHLCSVGVLPDERLSLAMDRK